MTSLLVSEVAARYPAVSRRTVLRMIDRGDLKAEKLGNLTGPYVLDAEHVDQVFAGLGYARVGAPA